MCRHRRRCDVLYMLLCWTERSSVILGYKYVQWDVLLCIVHTWLQWETVWQTQTTTHSTFKQLTSRLSPFFVTLNVKIKSSVEATCVHSSAVLIPRKCSTDTQRFRFDWSAYFTSVAVNSCLKPAEKRLHDFIFILSVNRFGLMCSRVKFNTDFTAAGHLKFTFFFCQTHWLNLLQITRVISSLSAVSCRLCSFMCETPVTAGCFICTGLTTSNLASNQTV